MGAIPMDRGGGTRFEKCYCHASSEKWRSLPSVRSRGKSPVWSRTQQLKHSLHFLFSFAIKADSCKNDSKSQRKAWFLNCKHLLTVHIIEVLAKAINGHNNPKSAMTMAIVDIPVAPPPLLRRMFSARIWRRTEESLSNVTPIWLI